MQHYDEVCPFAAIRNEGTYGRSSRKNATEWVLRCIVNARFVAKAVWAVECPRSQ